MCLHRTWSKRTVTPQGRPGGGQRTLPPLQSQPQAGLGPNRTWLSAEPCVHCTFSVCLQSLVYRHFFWLSRSISIRLIFAVPHSKHGWLIKLVPTWNFILAWVSKKLQLRNTIYLKHIWWWQAGVFETIFCYFLTKPGNFLCNFQVCTEWNLIREDLTCESTKQNPLSSETRSASFPSAAHLTLVSFLLNHLPSSPSTNELF